MKWFFSSAHRGKMRRRGGAHGAQRSRRHRRRSPPPQPRPHKDPRRISSFLREKKGGGAHPSADGGSACTRQDRGRRPAAQRDSRRASSGQCPEQEVVRGEHHRPRVVLLPGWHRPLQPHLPRGLPPPALSLHFSRPL